MDSVDRAVTHVDLLAHCTRLEQAGMSRDLAAVHAALGSLRSAFARHRRSEEASFDQFTPTVAAIVHSGQERLLERIDDLLGKSVEGRDECGCFSESLHLTRQIARQARYETTLLVGLRDPETVIE